MTTNRTIAARISSISVAIGFGIALACGAPAAAEEPSPPPPVQCEFDNPIPLAPAMCAEHYRPQCGGLPQTCWCEKDPENPPTANDESPPPSPPPPGATAIHPPGTDKRGIQ
jgi:hypothetical protein